ncbi:lantibiotic dehydratase [Echinicola marina]|uniref:thiopeptide-type bacteriocin biosynthesis protein n=1 Tax=Echinicola marina TaxID=2859768 RepID=UPI001CF6952A|nr:thiopeptide-type bacteriocin biosynthesis protein [Echinicola marina]UCS95051.1 lantibiotic dehydratase [Echinicola marina]
MDFIYRLPLLDFDITDDGEIQRNYTNILKAIQYSSPEYYEQIKHKTYAELNCKEKQTFNNYLKRGRYRPIPFGHWASVGLGEWSDNKGPWIIKAETETIKHTISVSRKNEHYCLSASIKKSSSHYIYWSIDKGSELWEEYRVLRNPIIDQVYKFSISNKVIGFQDFQSWFIDPEIDESEIHEVWKGIIATGMIIPYLSITNLRNREKSSFLNSYTSTIVCQHQSIKDELDNIRKEMGAIFDPSTSFLLQQFKSLFLHYYDDKTVPIQVLIKQCDPIMEYLKTDVRRTDEIDHPTLKLNNRIISIFKHSRSLKQIDLHSEVKKKEIVGDYSLSVLYRLGFKNQIIIDSCSTNKNHSLVGRFSHHQVIGKYLNSELTPISRSEKIIYADLPLMETQVVNNLSFHKNYLPYTINYLQAQPSSKNEITLDRICISIWEDEVILSDIKTRQKIVPISQHAIHPRHISHPLGRLFWEIGNQYSRYLTRDFEHIGEQLSFSPRILWKKIVLQPALWWIKKEDLPENAKQKSIRNILSKKDVPRYITIGEEDQELLVDTTKQGDIELILAMINKYSKIRLKECLWIYNSTYTYQNRNPLYPQFLVNLPLAKSTLGQENFYLNPISGEYLNNVINIYVYITPRHASEFLTGTIIPFIRKHSGAKRSLKWYYLAFRDEAFHIRLRVISKNKYLKKELLYLLSESSQVSHYKTMPYYPENHKYDADSIDHIHKINHLESEFLCSNFFSREGIMAAKKETKLKILVHIFLRLIKGLNKYDEIFQYLKRKNNGSKTSKWHRNYYDVIRTLSIPIEEMNYLEEFTKPYLLNYNQADYNLNQKSIKVLFHHIHMMVNRTFLDEANTYEPLIYYLLYRELGALVYKNRLGNIIKK